MSACLLHSLLLVIEIHGVKQRDADDSSLQFFSSHVCNGKAPVCDQHLAGLIPVSDGYNRGKLASRPYYSLFYYEQPMRLQTCGDVTIFFGFYHHVVLVSLGLKLPTRLYLRTPKSKDLLPKVCPTLSDHRLRI